MDTSSNKTEDFKLEEKAFFTQILNTHTRTAFVQTTFKKQLFVPTVGTNKYQNSNFLRDFLPSMPG